MCICLCTVRLALAVRVLISVTWLFQPLSSWSIGINQWAPLCDMRWLYIYKLHTTLELASYTQAYTEMAPGCLLYYSRIIACQPGVNYSPINMLYYIILYPYWQWHFTSQMIIVKECCVTVKKKLEGLLQYTNTTHWLAVPFLFLHTSMKGIAMQPNNSVMFC